MLMMIMIPNQMRIDTHIKNVLDWYADQLDEQQPWIGGMVCYAADHCIFADALYSLPEGFSLESKLNIANMIKLRY